MPVGYKIDVIAALKSNGLSTYRIRKDKIFSESTLQSFRDGIMVSYDTIGKLCSLLDCQPGDILEYVPEDPAMPKEPGNKPEEPPTEEPEEEHTTLPWEE